MKNRIQNPFKNLTLNVEEKEITKAIETDKIIPVDNVKTEIKRYKQIAKATLDKTRNINIRLTERDLLKIKSKAMETGIPYQTLVTSILHQAVG
jgi:predicted DNA binding CopG/RHH family protein